MGTFRELIRDTLSEIDRPSTVAEIWERIQANGTYRWHHESPEQPLGAFLYTATQGKIPSWDGVFMRVGDGSPVRFWFADRPIPGGHVSGSGTATDPGELRKAAYFVLLDADGPLTPEEVVAGIEARGWCKGRSGNPVGLVSAFLSGGVHGSLTSRSWDGVFERTGDTPPRYRLTGVPPKAGGLRALDAEKWVPPVPPKSFRDAIAAALAELGVPASYHEVWSVIQENGWYDGTDEKAEDGVSAFLYSATLGKLDTDRWEGVFRRVPAPGGTVLFELTGKAPGAGKEKVTIGKGRPVPAAPANVAWCVEQETFPCETDKHLGIEVLVNNAFFALLPFEGDACVLIRDNKGFATPGGGVDAADGVSGIPDGLLLVPDGKDGRLSVWMVEYESVGRRSPADRSRYFMSHILPQLSRFAMAFSTAIDQLSREKCIQEWCNTLSSRITGDPESAEKARHWQHAKDGMGLDTLKLYKALEAALRERLGVLLITDELTDEQESTLDSVVHAFRLPAVKGRKVDFRAFRVSLVRGDGDTYGLVLRK